MHGVKVSKCKVSNIINQKEKTINHFFNGAKNSKRIFKKVHIVLNLSEEKTLATRKYPPTAKSTVKSLNISVAIINKITNQYFQFNKNEKT